MARNKTHSKFGSIPGCVCSGALWWRSGEQANFPKFAHMCLNRRNLGYEAGLLAPQSARRQGWLLRSNPGYCRSGIREIAIHPDKGSLEELVSSRMECAAAFRVNGLLGAGERAA